MQLIECLLVAILTAATAAEPAPPSPDQSAIEATARAFVAAYDAGDAEAVAALWTPDGEYVVGAQSVQGRPAIKAVYERLFAAHPGSKMQIKIQAVRSVAPNVAIEDGTATVTSSAVGPDSSSQYSVVHVKQGGKWLMASVRESDVPLPVPQQDLQQLAWLVGDWVADGDSARVEAKYTWLIEDKFLLGRTTVHAKNGEEKLSGGAQIVGLDPQSGQIATWFFNADGGHAYGVWIHVAKRWAIDTQGVLASGDPTTATNVFYRADNNVISWQSVNRTVGGQVLPDIGEIVLERTAAAPLIK